MLSEKQLKTLDELEDLKKRIHLLDSHKVVGYINNKQYAESLTTIMKEVERIEEQYGVKPENTSAKDILYNAIKEVV